MNKYEKWNKQIVERGQPERNLTEKTEVHHIIPECLSGPDTPKNKTTITVREHFICHWLLTKIYTTGKERYLILNALQGMRRENKNQQRYHTKITSRVYAHLKEEWAKLSSERIMGDKNPMWGKHHTEEAKERIRQKNLGSTLTVEQKAKITASKKGKKRAAFTEDWKDNLSKNHKSKQPGFVGSL